MAMRTLKLTSPHLRGPDVKAMQAAIAKHGWLKGGVDGEYGVLTAQSAYRAKYWLGYMKPDQAAGQVLLDYLTGKKPPTDAMVKRASDRRKAAAAKPLREKAFDEAVKWVGTKESPPGSNKCKFSDWYGVRGPWCAMFATWCYVQAGSLTFRRGAYYAYVPNIVGDARQGRNHLTVTNDPQHGDLVCFDWNRDGTSDHVGLFDRWTDSQHTQFKTCEGNTGDGNDSNGGEVMRRDRYRNVVQVFAHVSK